MFQYLIVHKSKIIFTVIFIIIITTVTMCCSWNPFKQKDSKKFYWNHYQHPYTYHNFIMNAIATENAFITITHEMLMIFDSFDTHPDNIDLMGNLSSLNYKPIMSEDFSVYFEPIRSDRLSLFWHSQANIRGTTFSVTQFGEEFKDYTFWIGYENSDFGAINPNKNRFVGVMRGPNPNVAFQQSSYPFYIDVAIVNSHIWVVDKGFWDIPALTNGWMNFSGILHIDGYFYLAAVNRNVTTVHYIEIAPDGTWRELPDPFPKSLLRCLFVYKDHIFGTVSNADSHQILYYTNDFINWNSTGIVANAPVLQLKEIGDYAFGNVSDNIYVMSGTIEYYGLRFYEIPKENIKGSIITSFNKYKDDLVITTTNGVFYKSFDEVITKKTLVLGHENNMIYIEGE